MKPDKIFDIYSENYDVKFNSNPVGIYQRQCVHNILEPLLGDANTLLDIGCGPGSDFEFYKKCNINITAFDISPKMVQLAKNKADLINLNAEIFNSSLEIFETENKYDIILLNFGVINTFNKIEKILQKLEYLLELNGILVIVSMPPFHLFSILEYVFRFQFKKLYHRLINKKMILKNGFEFYYYSKSDFNKIFTIKNKRVMCSILPTPDQHSQNNFLRLYFKLLCKVDKLMGKYLFALCGGDHIVFELVKKRII